MLSVCRDEDKEPLEANQVNVREPRGLPSRAARTGDVDAMLLDELSVEGPWVLRSRDVARHVEPVAAREVITHELLDEPLDRGRFHPIAHGAPPPRSAVSKSKGGARIKIEPRAVKPL